MRFNKSELATLASNSKTKFEKEGLLIITERQEGFFRRTDVNSPRWCKLRGNLFFYQKTHEKTSEPVGILVLENCRTLIKVEEREFDGFAFILEFEGCLPQRISARTAQERLDWVKCIQLASYTHLNRQIQYLEDQIALLMGNSIEKGLALGPPAMDATLLTGLLDLNSAAASNSRHCGANKVEEDLSEIPICESSVCCDNLPFNADNGRPPNPRVVCAVLTSEDVIIWKDFARTEVMEHTANPQFLCTFTFKQSDGFNSETSLRFTVYNVKEKLSRTSVPIGYAEVVLGAIQDSTRFRIPLRSVHGECGFINICSWAPDTTDKAVKPPPRSTTQEFKQQSKGHRRTQSLPPKLGIKLFVPFQGGIQKLFANPKIHTYRLNSSLGGDISVHEAMLESKLCYAIPQQLLSIWILREKELLQEISGMGELGGEWRSKQIDLLDKHLKLLGDYSQAKQNIQQILKEDAYFKRSADKTDESLEFIPINLHLQRMWAQNDSLNRTGLLDIITVGAFTRHASKAKKTGGLIRLLQASNKQSRADTNVGNNCKVAAANKVVQAIKLLRTEIVEIMSQLLESAKTKNPKGMMALCSEMIMKTKKLLNIWDPCLVNEAFAFVEQHRIIEEPDNVLVPMSPFRKITQQLNVLELKSPELEDFCTPIVAPPDLWPRVNTPTNSKLMRSNSLTQLEKCPSLNLDLNTIQNLQHSIKAYNEHLQRSATTSTKSTAEAQGNQPEAFKIEDDELQYQSLPANINFNEDEHELMMTSSIILQDLDEEELPTQLSSSCESSMPKIPYSTQFLDTRMMSSSPSANYYRPTEEPEPLDLTQLNIEASVMCLVSKIKFLCGRCGSPAIRLRHPKTSNNLIPPPDLVDNGNSEIADKFQIPESNDLACTTNGNNLSLNLDLTQTTMSADNQANRKGNKFTDGLNLSLTTDWIGELRPSMRKLRHAMDGLLKTARLIHSVQRLHQDEKITSMNLEVMYRRDVCFSQSLTALISALMVKLWGTEINNDYITILLSLGPLAYFEGLLSYYGNEIDMWGDMCIAIEDLLTVEFMLIRHNATTGNSNNNNNNNENKSLPMPSITGCRQSLKVYLPVPEHVYNMLPTTSQPLSFKVVPVFFNIGINEKATLAEAMGQTREQHRSNWDNYIRLKQYYSRFRNLSLISAPDMPNNYGIQQTPAAELIYSLLIFLEDQLKANISKNVKILHLAEDICRLMAGLRFTSCKSAKDRTGMAVTLEQARVLVQEFQLPAKNVPCVLNTMRSEGCRMDNVFKNIGKHKYAFNLPQILSLPVMYRAPAGAYGKAET